MFLDAVCRIIAAVVPLFSFTLCSAFSLWAQSTFATITGVATDPNGALVPGVEVEVVHLATSYRYTAVTNEAGQYSLPNLREGLYRLRAKRKGFKEFVADRVELSARDLRRVDIPLQLATVETQVEVVASAALIETETARISDVKGRDLLRALPNTYRRSWDFFQLAPNVTRAGGSWDLRFAGSRRNQGEQTLDGVSVGSGLGTGTSNQQMVWLLERTESIEELRIDTAGNSAEYPAIGQAAFITRSGSNSLHGSALWYYTTPGLQARDPFAAARTGRVSHALGFSISGPVWIPKVHRGKDKTFFYFSREWDQNGPARILMTPTVPLEPWRNGDFSGLLPGTVVGDPAAGGTPFAGNLIPASRLNPVALKIQNLYPLPNYGDPTRLISPNHRAVVLSPSFVSPTYVGRLDHRLSERSFLFGRITLVDNLNSYANRVPLPTLFPQRKEAREVNGLTATHTHSFRPTLLNEFRWGYAKNVLNIKCFGGGKQLVKDWGLVGLAPDLPDLGGYPSIGWSGISLTGINELADAFPYERNLTFNFHDHVSWFRGRHSLRAGVQFTQRNWTQNSPGFSLFGNITFSNRFTGHPYSDFLLGLPTTGSRSFPPLTDDTHRWSQGYFFQDEFRKSPKITLTFGLRYDYHAPWVQEGDLLAAFDIEAGRIVVPDAALGKVSSLLPRGYVDVVKASTAEYDSRTLLRGDKNNFAPRIGAAWRPLGNNAVFRGSYGIYYDIVPTRAAAAGVPFQIAQPGFTNPADKPTVVLPRVFPAISGGPATVSLPSGINPNLRIPYSMQYSATVEHQRWSTGFRISYIGTNTRQGVWSYDVNQPIPDTRPYVDKPRRFPSYPGISYLTNGAGHQYHALTLQALSRRSAHGLDFQVYYTLARDIGDLETGEAPENAYDRRREKAVWSDIPTHRFNVNALYALPVGPGKAALGDLGKIAGVALGGWQISAQYAYEGGQFLTPVWQGSDPTGTRYTTSRTPALVSLRPDHLRNANLHHRTVQRWFDVAAFAAPQPGHFGTSAKGVIIGPPVNVFHAALMKNFRFRERGFVRLAIQSSNVLNHPNWANPNTTITAAGGAAVITATQNVNTRLDNPGNRLVRLHLRVEF